MPIFTSDSMHLDSQNKSMRSNSENRGLLSTASAGHNTNHKLSVVTTVLKQASTYTNKQDKNRTDEFIRVG